MTDFTFPFKFCCRRFLATNGQQEYQKRPFFGLNNKKIQIIKFAYLPIQNFEKI